MFTFLNRKNIKFWGGEGGEGGRSFFVLFYFNG